MSDSELAPKRRRVAGDEHGDDEVVEVLVCIGRTWMPV